MTLTVGRELTLGYRQFALLMRRAGPPGLPGRPPMATAPNLLTASHLVDRQSARDRRDGLWVTASPSIPLEGKVYCAVVLDA